MSDNSTVVLAGLACGSGAHDAGALAGVSNRFRVMCGSIFQVVEQFRATDVEKISVAKRYLSIDPVSAKGDNDVGRGVMTPVHRPAAIAQLMPLTIAVQPF
jgi:hypothetical protein